MIIVTGIKFIFKTIAALVAAALLLITATIILLTVYPLDSTRLSPYLENLAQYLFPNTTATIGSSDLVWDNQDFTAALTIRDFRLLDNITGTDRAEAAALEIKFSIARLLTGNLMPLVIEADHPRVHLIRSNNETAHKTSESHAHSVLALLGGHLPERVDLQHAYIILHDETTSTDSTLYISSATLGKTDTGTTGAVKIAISQGSTTIPADMTYNLSTSGNGYEAMLQWRGITPALLADLHPELSRLAACALPLDGEIRITTNADLTVTDAALKINGGSGNIIIPTLWLQPRPVDSMTIEAEWENTSHTMTLTAATVDFGATLLHAKGNMVLPSDATISMTDFTVPTSGVAAFSVNLELTDLPLDEYADTWPLPALPDARAWIADNLKRGTLTHGTSTFRGRIPLENPSDTTLDEGMGKLTATGAEVTYVDGMPVVQNVAAEATFDMQHMDIAISGGTIGNVKLLPSTLRLTDFDKDIQYLDAPLNITGPVSEVLKIIDYQPLGYARKIGLKPADGAGQVTGNVTLRLPLIDAVSFNDVIVIAEAKLTGFGLANIARGIDLRGGVLDMKLDATNMTLKGTLNVNGVPLRTNWQTVFVAKDGYSSHKATATGTITGEQWKQLGITEAADIVQGTTAVTLNFAMAGKGTINLDSVLDLRRTDIKIPDLNWTKAANIPASLTFTLFIPPASKDIRIDKINLNGGGANISGSAIFDTIANRLRSLDINTLDVGRTKAKVTMTREGQDFFPVKISGAAFDATGIFSNKSGEKERKNESTRSSYTFDLGKLYTDDDSFVSGLKGIVARTNTGDWDEVKLDGMVQGSNRLTIALQKINGPAKRTLEINCDDFGIALKGFGLTDDVKGGVISVIGTSTTEDPTVINGNIKISRFTISGLPLLMRLIAAVSPLGFTDLLSGETSFDRLSGNFRLQGDNITLSDVNAAGDIVGININGKINIATGSADLNGTLVPFSFVNRIINWIPLLGNLITGGEGQGVIAVAYTIKGSLADPTISVNPVSMLTPGFVRNIFFGGE